MPIRPIVKFPDERLRLISKDIEDPAAVQDLVRDMTETMYASDGAGLAAIQVGEPLNLFIIEATVAGADESAPPIVFINPQILELSEERYMADEGCLSFPGIFVPIERSLRARVRATDLEGKAFEMKGEGLLARAMQHESDHLNGKLLADYVGRIKRQLITRKLAKARDAEE